MHVGSLQQRARARLTTMGECHGYTVNIEVDLNIAGICCCPYTPATHQQQGNRERMDGPPWARAMG